MDWVQVLTIGKISAAVVLAGAAYQDEENYARMANLPRDKTRLIDDKDGTDTQVWHPSPDCCFSHQPPMLLKLEHAHMKM